ncbi:MAG: hypothetical protein ACOYT4_01740 [Nanoarchaeota archaeon]
MINIFLETAASNIESFAANVQPNEMMAAVLALFFIVLLIAFFLAIALYVYVSLAYMNIAKKTNTEPAWLAWIPIANFYLMSKIADMRWWPMLLLIGIFIPFIGPVFWIAFLVFLVIWNWKILRAVEQPGWIAIFMIIPMLNIVFLIFLGIGAWSEEKNHRRNRK